MCPQRGAPWRVRQSLQSVVCQWNVWQPTEGSVQRSLSINDRIGGHAAPPTEHHQQQRIYLLTYLLIATRYRPPDRTWRRPPGRPRNKWLDQLRNDSTLPNGDLSRRAVDRGHGCATTRRPSPAARRR